MLIHLGKERNGNWETRGRPNHRVDSTERAERCLADVLDRISPVDYRIGMKDAATVEAAAGIACKQLLTVSN